MVVKALDTIGNQEGEEPDGLAELENKHATAIAAAINLQISSLFGDTNDYDEVVRRLGSEFDGYSNDLQNYILMMMLEYANFGVDIATNKIRQYAAWFDPTESYYMAREFATQRANEAFLLVQETSKRRLTEILKAGQKLGIAWMISEASKFFNERRAFVISSNESITVIRQAEMIVYRNSKIIDMVRWVTMRDERVCAACGPRHRKIYPLSSTAMPPLHIGCRCQLLPLIDKSKLQTEALNV